VGFVASIPVMLSALCSRGGSRDPRHAVIGLRLPRWAHGVGILLALLGAARAEDRDRLDWRPIDQGRVASLHVPPTNRAGFQLLAPSTTGVTFTNVLLENRHLTNQILLNGAGMAAGDVNGDGWCDLYFCHSYGSNALFLNRGAWRFEQAADAGGAPCPFWVSTGATLADLDGDLDLDLIVRRSSIPAGAG
jgi:hypothetical protein